MLVDSHCHLDFDTFAKEIDDVVARAHHAGVSHMVTISTRVRRAPQIIALAEKFENVFCSVGTHPHQADEERGITADEIVELTQHPKVVAIGEAGLDYFYQYGSREAQHEGFLTHIEVARRTQLPLVIHTRDADSDTAQLLTNEMKKGAFPALLHCFTGGRELAHKAIELGLYISFSGILTFGKSEELRAIAADLPADRILVETDSPFLAPGPHRGKRNEPAFVAETAKVLAKARNVSAETIAKQTSENFFRLFSKVPAPRVSGMT